MIIITLSVPFFTLFLASLVRSACECGYTVNSTLFTDLIESDFLHIENITTDTDWQPQEYTVPPDLARGPFGKSAELSNVVANPLESEYDWAGDGVNGGDAGLQLIVRGGTPDEGGLIPMAELATVRSDFRYGSFRAGIKISSVNGTCGAFFWYYNNTQEIDIEFLTSQMNDSSSPVNLVLQSEEAEKQGFAAQGTDDFVNKQLPYQPSEGFHEYRFDWTPDAVEFYADGVLLQRMENSVPDSPGHITLSHWSNGDPRWSAGPPESDATLTISYLKGYFNSTDPKRQEDWDSRCPSTTTVDATCEVPDVTDAPDGNSSARTFFFSKQDNMTINQTVSGLENAGSSLRWAQTTSTAVIAFMIVSMMECCL